jgi:hypothetical protein
MAFKSSGALANWGSAGENGLEDLADFARPVQAGSEHPNRPEFFFTKILYLNLPCFQPLAVFLPRLGFTSMLLLNRVRSCARRNLPNPNFLRRKRCFSGGTDTSRRLLRPCGTHRAVCPMGTDGRNVKSILQSRNVPA